MGLRVLVFWFGLGCGVPKSGDVRFFKGSGLEGAGLRLQEGSAEFWIRAHC